MIIWDKKNGYTYKDETTRKEYSLHEMKCYQGEASSDIVAIWDDASNCFANYVYGAEFLHESIEELNNTIKFYVDDYEAKQKEKAKAKAEIVAKYKCTKAGVKAFLDEASTDFFAEMEKPWDDQHLENFDIVISCGKRKISIPLGAEEWNGIEVLLTDAAETWEE